METNYGSLSLNPTLQPISNPETSSLRLMMSLMEDLRQHRDDNAQKPTGVIIPIPKFITYASEGGLGGNKGALHLDYSL